MANATASHTTRHPIIAGVATPSRDLRPVADRTTGGPLAQLAYATPEDIEAAIASAHAARDHTASLTSTQRRDILDHLARRVGQERQPLAESITREAAKPIADARNEVERCIATLDLSARAAHDLPAAHDHTIESGNSDIRVSHHRVPVGPCALITPFNFPLNLVAHKIGPAIAAGNPFILKPADKAPLSALRLVDFILETDYPTDAVNCLVADPDHLDPLIADERIRFVSFTGSDRVGWTIRERARGKRVALELGGDAAVILDRHLTPSQIDHAAQRTADAAFRYAGQSCISTQRVILHDDIAELATERILHHTSNIQRGNLLDENTDLAPMIDAAAADRIERWIDDAVQHGAVCLTGAHRDGNTIAPTVLTNVPADTPLASEEAFGPVATIRTAASIEAAIGMTNDSRYGIHLGVFTNDESTKAYVIRHADVGGVLINETPTFRVDAEPYGGVKHSGIGREGPAFALLEMTEQRAVISRPWP